MARLVLTFARRVSVSGIWCLFLLTSFVKRRIVPDRAFIRHKVRPDGATWFGAYLARAEANLRRLEAEDALLQSSAGLPPSAQSVVCVHGPQEAPHCTL